jgi:hypothetical protein
MSLKNETKLKKPNVQKAATAANSSWPRVTEKRRSTGGFVRRLTVASSTGVW